MLDSQQESIQRALSNIESMMNRVEVAELERQFLPVLREGAEALKGTLAKVDISEVDKIQATVDDADDISERMKEITSEPLAENSQQELEDELSALSNEIDEEKLRNRLEAVRSLPSAASASGSPRGSPVATPLVSPRDVHESEGFSR